MADGLKIVVIGGGSSYTPELIEGFVKRFNSLPVKEIRLVDIEQGKEKLEIIGALASRMVKNAGVPITIKKTIQREEALEGADFVITQIRVGGLEGRIKDETIPLSLGCIGQETNGPGGLFLGLRTIPVILEIAREIERLCPKAWLINFTNPAGMVVEALLKYAPIQRVVGLCNVPLIVQRAMARCLGIEHHRLRIDFAGLNHMVFGLKTYLDGNDISEKVTTLLAERSEEITMNNIPATKWDPEFITALGVIPCPYHRYYFKKEQMLAEQLEEYNAGTTRAQVVVEMEKNLFEIYKDEGLKIKPPLLDQRGGAYYSDAACSLIDSLYNDRKDIQTVNVRNNGAIKDLPPDGAVEVSSIITGEGPVPLVLGELPVSVKGLVRTIKSFEELAVEAAVHGDRGLAIVALTIHPLVSSDGLAKKLFMEMFKAHREFLPQFK